MLIIIWYFICLHNNKFQMKLHSAKFTHSNRKLCIFCTTEYYNFFQKSRIYKFMDKENQAIRQSNVVVSNRLIQFIR